MSPDGAALPLNSPVQRFVVWFAILLSLCAAAPAAADAKRTFDLPAADAATSLKQFAVQAQREIMFPAEPLAGVRTNRVEGTLTPREALDRLIANTGLVIVEDSTTGALMVTRPAATVAQITKPNPDSPPLPPKSQSPMKQKTPLTLIAGWLLATLAPTGATAGDDPTAKPERKDDVVQLSPFEVTEANNGYYASNTMSGTRLNTSIEDLASSISVVTKQQMADFAMLDINDIFNYEAGTEGTGNYTDFSIDGNGMVHDNIQNNPQGANRIRGIGAANIALDNFATSGRVPIDPISIDGVEISRGPNSNIFGLGQGSGTVNLLAASASLNRDVTTASVRLDSVGGYRTSLDLNRPLVKNKLAFRTSVVYQRDAYNEKPSGATTHRYNFMLRAQPFKSTSVRASFQQYEFFGTRANTLTPRDTVSYWKSVGSPTWDPTTSTVTVNGVSTALGATNPAGLGAPTFSDPVLFVDQNGISLWEIQHAPATTALNGPNNVSGTARFLETISPPVRTNHPLFSTVPGLTDKSIFDWSSINLAGINSIKDHDETTTVEIEQYFLNTERQQIAAQLGWNHEFSSRFNKNVVGQASATGNSNYLYVDVNSKLLDGRPNPYFMRPYLGIGEPLFSDNPYVSNTFRGQLAYKLDLTQGKNWTKWLGRFSLVGYAEERTTTTDVFRYRDVNIADNPIYAPAGQPKGNQSGVVSPLATRGYYHFYVGDSNGQNVDYAPGAYKLGQYTFNWLNAQTNQWVADQATLGEAAIQDGANASNLKNLIKTRGVVLQDAVLQDRLVFTGGRRHDENYNKVQQQPVLNPDGYTFNYPAFAGYVGDWAERQGDTTTTGFVAKPFRGWSLVDQAVARGGAAGFFASTLRGLNLHYNKSDSFTPSSPAMSITMETLPDPSSNGKDYGFSLNLWDGKLVLRANRYVTNLINNRDSNTPSTRALRIDIQNFLGNADAFSLQRQARNWVAAANPTFSTQQVDAAVYGIMGLSAAQVAAFNANTIGETKDQTAKGDELELNYNPDHFWTLKLNVTKMESIDANLDPHIFAWIAQRTPIWTTVVDPRSGKTWWTTGYSGDSVSTTGTTPQTYLAANVVAPALLAQATQGKSRPEIREWHYNFSGSVRLAKYTEQKILKNVSLGGSLRWESKGAIGYYGIPVNGDIAQATQYDPNRPIYTKPNTYLDAFVTYNTRLFRDKVRARFQLNARNLQEWHARLEPVAAFPDGSPNTFRIIEPMTVIFTSTFDL
jgi:hypothetical protein